jgi:hypothetical protein
MLFTPVRKPIRPRSDRSGCTMRYENRYLQKAHCRFRKPVNLSCIHEETKTQRSADFGAQRLRSVGSDLYADVLGPERQAGMNKTRTLFRAAGVADMFRACIDYRHRCSAPLHLIGLIERQPVEHKTIVGRPVAAPAARAHARASVISAAITSCLPLPAATTELYLGGLEARRRAPLIQLRA